jgi:lipopolysaccharide assembly outer membrane protein LptD (OstA)
LHGYSVFRIILLTLLCALPCLAFSQISEKEFSIQSTDSTASNPVDSVKDITNDSTLIAENDSVAADSISPESTSVLDYVVEYDATDSILVNPITNVVTLYNDAVVVYGDIKLKAGFIILDLEKDEIYARGIPDSTGKVIQKPIFTEKGKDYQTDTMRYNFRTQKAKIYKVITAESEGFLHGDQIKKNGEVYFMKKGYFTTCSHEDPHFKIQTNKAKVIPGEKIITGAAYLEVNEVPTPLILPFGFFPTQEERASGIIIPTYVNNQQRGLGIRGGGYYFALSDYYDLQLIGEIFTRGGYGLNAISNYAKKYRYNGKFTLGYNVLRIGEERFAEFEPFQVS